MAEVTAEASDSNHQGQGDAVIQQQEQDQEEQVCFICDTSITDPDALGEWFRTELTSRKTGPLTIHCHYFCLLFSCNLKQMGKEDEGIRGFLAEDIERERHRGRQLTCYFCHKSGPTSACCEKSCKVAYHLPCAVYSRKEMEKLVPADFFKGTTSKEVAYPGPGNTVIRFVDPYETFCSSHRPPKKVEELDILNEKYSAGSLKCHICDQNLFTKLVCQYRYHFIQCPHCFNNQHIKCVRTAARIAGEEHLMCPACMCSKLDAKADDKKDKIQSKIRCHQDYVDYCRKYGVYVPEKDADWENDETYFEDQKQEYSQCDADPCLCPKGNKHDDWDPASKDRSGDWYIVLCSSCAGAGSHRSCGKIAVGQDWYCDTCSTVVGKNDHDVGYDSIDSGKEDGSSDGNLDAEEEDEDEIVVNQAGDAPDGANGQQDATDNEAASPVLSQAVSSPPRGSESAESMTDLLEVDGDKRKQTGDQDDGPDRKKQKKQE